MNPASTDSYDWISQSPHSPSERGLASQLCVQSGLSLGHGYLVSITGLRAQVQTYASVFASLAVCKEEPLDSQLTWKVSLEDSGLQKRGRVW